VGEIEMAKGGNAGKPTIHLESRKKKKKRQRK
jgi:hypothetical protein